MPASAQTVKLEGLSEMQRAFKLADKKLNRELRKTLRDVVEPVRRDAEQLATSEIPRIGLPWSRMRIGVTTTSVYLAPRQRGTSDPARQRPNLAGLLLGRSMLPALDRNEREIVAGLEHMLGTVASDWEHA